MCNSDKMSIGDVLREMDIDFIVSGDYGITVANAAKFILNDHFLFLDVRTKEENDHLKFSFAQHIPLNELPDSINEIDKNKFIPNLSDTKTKKALQLRLCN